MSTKVGVHAIKSFREIFRDEYHGRGYMPLKVTGYGMSTKVSVITCRIPYKNKEPTLHKHVLNYQSHKCGNYCRRVVKSKSNGKFTTTCCFSYPRKFTKEFILHDVVSSIVGRLTNNFKKRLYDLPRKSNEECINDYNPDLLLFWGGNMDIQFVSEHSYFISNYVTKYVTKSEKSNLENLEFLDESQTPYQKATKFAHSLLRTRELGAHEAVDRILQNNGDLWRSSETYFFVPTTLPKHRTRTLKRINDLEN